ncbi:sensor histidine kinase [Nonomuraea typhae]|uniref:sensor histidine kinase n=1 Tax=Nonomuraea typhae TaxID=2603600 RepID=UPI0012FC92FB|nr:HAMP domain-containing sensor histidine kinase [Nonomuraea typhae]
MKPTIRVRLTLLYGGVFFAAGLILLGLTYLTVRGVLEDTRDRTAGTGQYMANHAIQEADGTQWFVRVPTISQKAAQADYERNTVTGLLTQGAISLTLLGALAMGAGWLVSGRVLRPLYQVTETARRVANGTNLSERIAYTGAHHDVKELADTFDVMLSRLAAAFDVQKRFVANASHELRTPLTINRTLVDVALRRADASQDAQRLGESLLVVNTRHERLIDGLLALAESENPVLERRLPVDLAEIAGYVADQAVAEAGRKPVVLHHALAPAPSAGDPMLLERLAQNLVENAIRHNVADGEVWITTRRTGDDAELVVANTGPVVPAYDLEAIFEPFRRLRTDRVRSDRGSGLGLSIVRATARAHGGTVVAEPREEGGLTVTVRLPASHVDGRDGQRRVGRDVQG